MTAPAQQVDEFTYADYLAAQQALNSAYVAAVYPILAPYAGVYVSAVQWAQIVSVLYLVTRDFRYESAELARTFYDSERARHVPPVEVPLFDAERLTEALGVTVDLTDRTTVQVPDIHPIYLARYELSWFVEAMGAVEAEFRKPEPQISPEIAPERIRIGNATLKVIGVGLKEIENGGRKTLLEAVNSDHVVKGWARVAGGEDSCAFCEMLISRGPVYKNSPRSAGLDVSNEQDAVQIWNRYDETGDDEELMALMNRWHENCDCKVVPVFKYEDWPGRAEYLSALALWKKSTEGYSGKEAFNTYRAIIEGRTPTSEKEKKKPGRHLSLVA